MKGCASTRSNGRPLDADALRAALRAVVGPVTIVTTFVDGRPWGLTVSAFTPVCFGSAHRWLREVIVAAANEL